MSFVKIHGFELAQNAYAQNFIVERLATDPTVVDAGRIWFNTTDKKFKVSTLDATDNVVVRSFRTLEELASQVNGASGSGLVGYDGQTGAEGFFTVTAGTLDVSLDSIVNQIDTNTKAISDIGTGSLAAIQAELDDTQTGAGLGATGSYTADPSANYLTTASSLFNADMLLDAQVKVNEDAISTLETSVNDTINTEITGLQNELDATQVGAGLGTTGSYTADPSGNYINTASTLFNADQLLDAQVKTNTDGITQLGNDLTTGLDLKVNKAGDVMSGNLNMSSNKIISLGNPDADQDAANKFYVDSVAQGLIVKDSVRVATTENITLSGLQTIDGVLLAAGDRVLVKSQTNAIENGVYVAVDGGAWTRSEDFDGTPTHEVKGGVFTFVQDGGTLTGNTGWVVINEGEVALGTDPVNWTQFTGLGQIVAGSGIKKDGNVLSIGFGAGIVELPTDEVGLDLYSVGGVFMTTDGTTEDITTAGQLSIKLADTSLSLSGAGLQISSTFSDNVNGIQSELDTTQAGAGLGTTGTYTPDPSANYITTASSLFNADQLLDAQVKLNTDAIDQEVTDRTTAVSDLQTELDATQVGAGLGTTGTYTADPSANYLTTASSLFNADMLLDAQVKVNEDAITTLKTDLNGTVYTEASASAATHTITHNLASDFIEASVWVLDPEDSSYKNDLVAITIVNNNSFTVDLTEARAIRVSVRAATTLS